MDDLTCCLFKKVFMKDANLTMVRALIVLMVAVVFMSTLCTVAHADWAYGCEVGDYNCVYCIQQYAMHMILII